MNTQIENIKTEIFTTKEHYLAFRQAWKDYINSGKARPSYIDPGYGGGIQKMSNLTGAHHLLFCLLTEKDIAVTFKPALTNSKQGFEAADYMLGSMHYKISGILNYDAGKTSIPSYLTPEKHKDIMEKRRSKIKEFLEPFGNTITLDMFFRLFDEFVNPAKLTNKVPEIKEAA